MVATKAASNGSSAVTAKAQSTAPSRVASKAPTRASSVAGDNGRAGLSLTKSGVGNMNPIQHGKMGQAERAFSAASTFLSGIMAISASQFIGAPLKMVDSKFYAAYMAWTKESFAVLVTTMTQWWSPTVVRVSGDDSMKDQLYAMQDGSLKCNFPHRLVLMANHQLYTDWLYLWWIAYTNKMHGHIYIILKESLKQLPIFGWGAQFYNFIFLSRKWATDKYRFKSALNSMKNTQNPMWLLIFPEGTNLSAETRKKSVAWAQKSGIPDMKHQLLPRTTGLQFCLKELKTTTNWLYDCTIAYEGIPNGMYGQDVFTLRSSFFEGRPPKSVNMFWRRFKISDIPIDNDEAFTRWLNNRWREKDYILDYFYKYNQFPEEDPTKALAAVRNKRKPKHAKAISTEVKAGGWDEFLSIFGPITSAAGALSSFDMTESLNLGALNLDALLNQAVMQPHLILPFLTQGNLAAVSQQAVSNALKAAQKSQALPQSVFSYLLKQPPKTQEQMKTALVTSAKQSGATEIANRASKASASKKNVSAAVRKDIEKAIKQTKTTKPSGATKTSSSPASIIHQAMPLAKMESVVTRPLTTAAVQTATASIRRVAAARQAPNQNNVKSSQVVERRQNAQNGPKGTAPKLAKTQPATTNAVNVKRKQSVTSVPSTTKSQTDGSVVNARMQGSKKLETANVG